MNKRNTRARIYLLVLMIAVFIVWKYRRANDLAEGYVEGTTMGTVPYHIKYLDGEGRNFKKQIDSLLVDFNQALSTYIPGSEISVFNREHTVTFQRPYFFQVLEASAEVYEKSGGAFDPTVGPLIDAWGFGAENALDPDSTQVDSLLQYVGFDQIIFNRIRAEKRVEGLKLNFSAIAKGQAIDVIGDYLFAQGIESYMVEIGGEVRCRGSNIRGERWVIGIEVPDEHRTGEVFDALRLADQGMATSGNYRNFRIVNGQKVAHTIDPATGFPKMQTLLSATVLAPAAMYADAYATACMVMGLEKARAMILSDGSLEAYFIYADEEGTIQTYLSPGLEGKTVNTQRAD